MRLAFLALAVTACGGNELTFQAVCDRAVQLDRPCPGDLAGGVAVHDDLDIAVTTITGDWSQYGDGAFLDGSGPCSIPLSGGTMDPRVQYVETTANALGWCELRILRTDRSVIDRVDFEVRAPDHLAIVDLAGDAIELASLPGYDEVWQFRHGTFPTLTVEQRAGADTLTGKVFYAIDDPDHVLDGLTNADEVVIDGNAPVGDHALTINDISGSPPLHVLVRVVP
jgi:hypothetical protein